MALARACGVEGIRIERAGDLPGAIDHAIKAGRPYVLEVLVDRDVKPPSTGSWQLPPFPHPEPTFGRRRLPGDYEAP